MIDSLDLRTMLAIGASVAFAAAMSMAIQAFRTSSFKLPLRVATLALMLAASSLILGAVFNKEPDSVVFRIARVLGSLGFLSGMTALILMYRSQFPTRLIACLTTLCLLGYSVWPSGPGLLNWSSFCQVFISLVAAINVIRSQDALTPKLRWMSILLCGLVALGPAPHLYSALVEYFGWTVPSLDSAITYRFRIALNVVIMVLGYSCMNGLVQMRDAGLMRESLNQDVLTGAVSRRHLFEVGDAWLAAERAQGHFSTTVLLLDVDHFKQVNDQWGHLVGDQVLKHCVHQIRQVIRQTDAIVGRYGGEEFCVLAPQITLDDAVVLAQRIRLQIADHPYVNGAMNIPYTVSIGLAQSVQSTTLTELIQVADERLYNAKRQGRNRVAIDETMMVVV
jgi:diguanylate cyclase (GGDEF)-like protein